MASWIGAIFCPNAARRASRAAVGSAFSRSLLLMKKQAGRPHARAWATAVSSPASTALEASTTRSTPSVAEMPEMTSATKSG